MAKAIMLGMAAGFAVYCLSVFVGLKVHIGGDLMAAAFVAANIATAEEKRKHPLR